MSEPAENERSWADRLIDRHDGRWGGAVEEAAREGARYPVMSAQAAFWSRVCQRIRQIRDNESNRAVPHVPRAVIPKLPRPGTECSCGGRNKSCFRCEGTGMVQSQGRNAVTIRTGVVIQSGDALAPKRGRAAKVYKPEKCPICRKKVGRGGIASHIRAKHPET